MLLMPGLLGGLVAPVVTPPAGPTYSALTLTGATFSAGKVSSRALRAGSGTASLTLPAGNATIEMFLAPGATSAPNGIFVQLQDSIGNRFGIDFLNNGFKPQWNGVESAYGTQSFRGGTASQHFAINTNGSSDSIMLFLGGSRIDYVNGGNMAAGAATFSINMQSMDYVEVVRVSSGSRYGYGSNTYGSDAYGIGQGITPPSASQVGTRDANTIVIWDFANNDGAGR